MGLFDNPTEGKVVTNANGTSFKYFTTDNKWKIVPNVDVYSEAEVDAFTLNKWVAPTTNLSMNSYKITGLAAGTTNGDAARFEQLHAENHDNTYHTTNYKADFSENSAFNKNFGTLGTEVCVGNDSRLSDSRNADSIKTATVDPNSVGLLDNKIMVYRTGAPAGWKYEEKPAGGSNPAMADITDVVITSVGDNDIIAWDNGTSKYINQTAAEAGVSAVGHLHNATYYTETEMNAFLHIGTANKAYASLILDGGYRIEDDLMAYTTFNHGNRDADDSHFYFQTGLPLTLGTLTLHVDYLYLYFFDADGSNFIDNVTIYGKSANVTTTLYNNTGDITTTGHHSLATGTDDWGNYDTVRVGLMGKFATQLAWEMTTILIRYWYDT